MTTYTGDTLAVIDETTPMIGGGICYVVTTAIIFNPRQVEADLAAFFDDTPNRKRHFHWHREGRAVIDKMLALIQTHEITATALYKSVAPKAQKPARKELLRNHAIRAEQNGVTHLIIEAGDKATNQQDLDVLVKQFRNRQAPYRYEHKTKSERTVWIADAFCGIVKEKLLNKETGRYDQLAKSGHVELEFLP